MNKKIIFPIELKSSFLIAILSFLTLLLAFNQPWVTSMDGDSMVYFTISKIIVETGEWLTPAYDGRLFFDHPPLVFWINALLFKLLGPAEWVAKLFSGFCGLGAVILTFKMGERYGNKFLGFYAGLTMILTYDFVKYLNKCRLDLPLVLFYTLALYFFLKAIEGEKNGFYLSGAFAGFAFLTKGIVSFGIYLTILILIFDMRKVNILKKKEIWIGLLVSLLIPSIWFIAEYYDNNLKFFKEYFFKQVQGSIEGRVGKTRYTGPFYYLTHMLKVYWPWMPFFIHGLYIILKEKEKKTVWRLAVIWFLVVFFSFSLASFKIHYYLLPMFPAVSLITARSLDSIFSFEWKLAGVKIFTALILAAGFIIAVLPVPLHRNRYPEISKMAPYLKNVFTPEDIIICYHCSTPINTPSFNMINSRLKMFNIYSYTELTGFLPKYKDKRTFIYVHDEELVIEPRLVDGYYPFIEHNGYRVYSKDPDLKLTGRIY